MKEDQTAGPPSESISQRLHVRLKAQIRADFDAEVESAGAWKNLRDWVALECFERVFGEKGGRANGADRGRAVGDMTRAAEVTSSLFSQLKE